MSSAFQFLRTTWEARLSPMIWLLMAGRHKLVLTVRADVGPRARAGETGFHVCVLLEVLAHHVTGRHLGRQPGGVLASIQVSESGTLDLQIAVTEPSLLDRGGLLLGEVQLLLGSIQLALELVNGSSIGSAGKAEHALADSRVISSLLGDRVEVVHSGVVPDGSQDTCG